MKIVSFINPGQRDVNDFLALLALWGPCPPPP
jgi:hypothetical protein